MLYNKKEMLIFAHTKIIPMKNFKPSVPPLDVVRLKKFFLVFAYKHLCKLLELGPR